ncbi:MAG: hypothetical protein ABII12_02160 [Planctomycetota bacterium]
MTSAAEIAETLVADEPAPTAGVTLTAALADVANCAEAGRAIIEVLPSGLELLDETAGGLVRGEYLALIGSPGCGKSLLADRIVLGALRLNTSASAIVVNLETATPVRVARLVAGHAVCFGPMNKITQCVPLGPLLRGELEEAGKRLVRQTVDALSTELGERLLFIDNVTDAAGLAGLIQTHRPDLFVLDHCGLVNFSDVAGSSATEQTDVVLRIIGAALRETNTAGLLINEVSKAGLTTGTADASAVRGSARLASLAGQLIGIVRDAEKTGDDPALLLQLWKNRHGRVLVQQQATLLGGLAYLSTGSVSAIPTKQRKGARNDA